MLNLQNIFDTIDMGIIDAGCAYICEWDDPTDKISQGDSFTDQRLRIIAKDLGLPDDLKRRDSSDRRKHIGRLLAFGIFHVEITS